MRMSAAWGRSAALRRMAGIGAGVVLAAVATGASGPGGGVPDAYGGTPADVPFDQGAVPDVATGALARPTSSSGLPQPAVGDLSWTDIPPAALRAYRRAEIILRSSAPGCGLDWEILAGIGRVESDHGRFGGATVNSDGTTTPPIYGVALNGEGDVAAISDTDNGTLDADQVWDRAVGPMQFLPSTWDVVGVDADDDGVANPFDLDDAALAAGVYLCAGDVDLQDRAQLRAALWRYNPSDEYVALVLSYIDAYRRGGAPPATPVPTPVDTVPTLDKIPDRPAHPPTSRPDDPTTATPTDFDGPAPPPSDDPRPPPPSDDPTPPPPSDDPTPPPPSDDPTPPPPSDDPTPPPPSDDPTPPPPSDDPTPPPPSDDPTTSPPPSDDPELTDVSGTLQRSEDGVDWTLDGATVLDFGPDDYVNNQPAEHDYDGDGTVETVVEELNGLAGQQVQLQVDETDSGDVVYTIDGMEYRPADGSAAPWESA
jgi:hypothetical protein